MCQLAASRSSPEAPTIEPDKASQRKYTMTIASFTDSTKSYETTDHDCTCGDWTYRGSKTGKPCKHMIAREAALATVRAIAFLELKARYDIRSQAVIEEKRAAYWTYELAIGA